MINWELQSKGKKEVICYMMVKELLFKLEFPQIRA
jgi:hypothetical protein